VVKIVTKAKIPNSPAFGGISGSLQQAPNSKLTRHKTLAGKAPIFNSSKPVWYFEFIGAILCL
jgi:hypothetical protein